jgi:hypothetical protein
MTRPGSVEARTSSTAVQRVAPTGRGQLGLRLGLCALPWRVAAHFVAQTVRHKVGDLQVFPAMARPGLEPGTPRFSGSRGRAIRLTECLQIRGFMGAALPGGAVGSGLLPAHLGLRGGLEVPNRARATAWVRSTSPAAITRAKSGRLAGISQREAFGRSRVDGRAQRPIPVVSGTPGDECLNGPGGARRPSGRGRSQSLAKAGACRLADRAPPVRP